MITKVALRPHLLSTSGVPVTRKCLFDCSPTLPVAVGLARICALEWQKEGVFEKLPQLSLSPSFSPTTPSEREFPSDTVTFTTGNSLYDASARESASSNSSVSSESSSLLRIFGIIELLPFFLRGSFSFSSLSSKNSSTSLDSLEVSFIW